MRTYGEVAVIASDRVCDLQPINLGEFKPRGNYLGRLPVLIDQVAKTYADCLRRLT